VPIVEVRGLTKVYGSGDTAVTALDHVDLSVDQGEFVAVMGPSGCGKSTLLNLVGGLDRPTDGQVFIADVDIATMSDQHITQLRRRKLGFVFQFFNLILILCRRERRSPLTSTVSQTASRQGRRVDRQGGAETKFEPRPASVASSSVLPWPAPS
jgi:putative ABC transport system ATP-binding protein